MPSRDAAKLTASLQSGRKTRARSAAAEVRHIIAILHKWGIHTLGQFAALKKEEVSAAPRPGSRADVGTRERQSDASAEAGAAAGVVRRRSFEFENEIETIEPLLFMLRRFLQQFSLRLGALYFVAKELKLRITFSDKKSYEHLFKIPEPSNNVEVLFRMLHTHLENFNSEAPIVAVSLEAQADQSRRSSNSVCLKRRCAIRRSFRKRSRG